MEAYDENMIDDGLRANLDLTEEIRDCTSIHVAAYQQRAAKYYNSQLKETAFRVGNLVLTKMEISNPKGAIGKMSPN